MLNDESHSKRRKGKGKGGKKMRALLERGDPSQYITVEGEECSMWDSNLHLLSLIIFQLGEVGADRMISRQLIFS